MGHEEEEVSDMIKALEKAKDLLERQGTPHKAAVLPSDAYQRLAQEIEKMAAMKAQEAMPEAIKVCGFDIHALPGLPEDYAYIFKDKEEAFHFVSAFKQALGYGLSSESAAKCAKNYVENRPNFILKGLDK
jgi:hypothetical protein